MGELKIGRVVSAAKCSRYDVIDARTPRTSGSESRVDLLPAEPAQIPVAGYENPP